MGRDLNKWEADPLEIGGKIKALRGRLGLTQARLAEQLGVSFATINRWENAQAKPSQLAWRKILAIEGEPSATDGPDRPHPAAVDILDFTGRPEAVQAFAEGERLSFGHIANPVFATEIAQIDPLPHQRIAVYDQMLRHPRLRFLLADDAGAGKTIMAGLYLREMLSRRLIRRILVVAPAGLVGNWRRELATLFSLRFRVLEGSEAGRRNPFVGDDSDRLIVSIDTLAGERMLGRLREPDVQPYDLVIFDEAHKLAADRGADLRVRRTDRYRLAEALAGVPNIDPEWRLPWAPTHLLLLTATPHMGKDYPYFALWRLLDPCVLSTPEAFENYPAEQRRQHFIRRTKEEMVTMSGRPLYPTRTSDTLGYDLSQGEVSEQALYDQTTEYLKHVYNRAKLLNRSAARLAMGVFQRRLASSTLALLRSFDRRIAKLTALIDEVQAGRLTMEQLILLQRQISDDEDVLDTKTADDERAPIDGAEENEKAEERLLQGVIATSIGELRAEREQVQALRDLAQRVDDLGAESKFEKLAEVLLGERFAGEKLIIFTEHRDTLDFLVRRLNGLGFTGQVAQIHGGMHYTEREKQVEIFRKPTTDGGARFLVCTDAAGEGINLQFCWIMINYDVPWNPARLEQRMGRIHRYGQKHDPVIILNLIAPKTREGAVLDVLLKKLERIRRELKSDKVFDVIGRLFAGVSIKQYMEAALQDRDGTSVAAELGGRLTKEQVEALAEREKSLFGDGGDVKRELPRLREELDNEAYRHLLPGFVRQYVESAAPLVDINIDGDPRTFFSLTAARPGAIDGILQALDDYPENLQDRLTVSRPPDKRDGVWIHPGEAVFERFRATVSDRLAAESLRGAVFVDPDSERPYFFHMAIASIVREADPDVPELGQSTTLECHLVGVMQFEGSELQICPVERLLLLKGGEGLPPAAQRLAAAATRYKDAAAAFVVERVARDRAVQGKNALLATIQEREAFLRRGFDYQEADLASARAKQSERARSGNRAAAGELEAIKTAQRELAGRRDRAIAVLRREPELISLAPIKFLAHALVVPSSDSIDRERHDANVEEIAMQIAWAWEESEGAIVKDVHTPELARAAGLQDHPGFDLLSTRASGDKRNIEVKGRAATGDVEMLSNEWGKAANLGPAYWLYAVYDCATSKPRCNRIQDPFKRLFARAKGSFLISAKEVTEAAEQ